VNLIGEHTDYNDGFVLPMAIERQTLLLGEPTDDQEINLHSLTTGEAATFNLRGGVVRGEPAWSNYVRGVVAGFQELKLPLTGFNAAIDSTPFGGGLSSSAALEVAAATFPKPCPAISWSWQKAPLCQKAEHEFARVPCGHHGSVCFVLGRKDHLLLLDCRPHSTELCPTDPDVAVLVSILTSGISTDGEYA
jgi:galactokinase